MQTQVLLFPNMKFTKSWPKLRVDWLLLIFFLLLLLLPFVVFSKPTTPQPPVRYAYAVLDDTIPAFVVTTVIDTLDEDYPAIFTPVDIALASVPTDTVYVICYPNEEVNVGGGPGIADTLMFTPYPAALIAKEFKVKPVDDVEVEGDHYGVLNFVIISDDIDYGVLSIPEMSYLILDNDLPPGINTNFPIDTFLTEGVPGVDLLLALNSIPTDTVIITIDPDDQLRITGVPGEAVEIVFPPNAGALSFDGAAIRAFDDGIYEGLHSGTIHFTISSDDPDYAALFIEDVIYPIADNDSAPGLNYTEPFPLELNEDLGEVPVIIALNSVPTDSVFITLTPNAQLRITGIPGEPVTLAFPPNSSALTNHVLNVRAYDDVLFEGEHFGNVSFTITTADDDYSVFTIPSFDILIHDNDLEPGITFTDTAALAGTESDTMYFSLVLESIPTSTVTINLDPDDDLDLGKGHNADLNLKFKGDSAIIAKTVMLIIYDDIFHEGPHIGVITCAVTTDDTIYDNYVIPDIVVQINDNDITGIAELNPAAFNIYPTVSTGLVQYNFGEQQEAYTINIYDMFGKAVYSEKVTANNGSLSLSDLPAGGYVITGTSDSNLYYQRINVIH